MSDIRYELCEIQRRVVKWSRIPLIGRHKYIWQVIRTDSIGDGEVILEGKTIFDIAYSPKAIESHNQLTNYLIEQGWENYNNRLEPYGGIAIEQFKRRIAE